MRSPNESLLILTCKCFTSEAGEWKSAVNMYRTRDLWEEAFRVAGDCKDQPELRKQVAFLWAKHLGSDSAVRLLNRLGLLDTAIDYATEHCVFDFAFELVRGCAPSKIADVHNKYAMFLEDEGKLTEAEEEFIKVRLTFYKIYFAFFLFKLKC